jgi:hypothetical protein
VSGDRLSRAAAIAQAYLAGAASRPVGIPVDRDVLRERLGGDLPERGEDPADVLDRLAQAADPGIVGTAGPRYFGFVVGGALPAAIGADWLTSAWDQNAGLYVLAPAATVVEARGLQGAPAVTVVVGDEAHNSIFTAPRMLGLGSETALRVPVDAQGRMRPDELLRVLAAVEGPAIVCAQAGNVNTGAIDPLAAIAEADRALLRTRRLDGGGARARAGCRGAERRHPEPGARALRRRRRPDPRGDRPRQRDGTAWLGGTVWHRRAAMRIAVSSHATTEQDARQTVAAILRAWRGVAT